MDMPQGHVRLSTRPNQFRRWYGVNYEGRNRSKKAKWSHPRGHKGTVSPSHRRTSCLLSRAVRVTRRAFNKDHRFKSPYLRSCGFQDPRTRRSLTWLAVERYNWCSNDQGAYSSLSPSIGASLKLVRFYTKRFYRPRRGGYPIFYARIKVLNFMRDDIRRHRGIVSKRVS